MNEMSRRSAVSTVVNHIDSVLKPLGFKRHRGRAWVRNVESVRHVIALEPNRSRFSVQWGVVHPGVVPLVWDMEAREGNVGDSILTGTPSGILGRRVLDYFEIPDPTDEHDLALILEGLTGYFSELASYLQQFPDSKAVVDYLLEVESNKDHRGFTVPMNAPLKLYICAALAAVDNLAGAEDFARRARVALGPFGGDSINERRLAKLDQILLQDSK